MKTWVQAPGSVVIRIWIISINSRKLCKKRQIIFNQNPSTQPLQEAWGAAIIVLWAGLDLDLQVDVKRVFFNSRVQEVWFITTHHQISMTESTSENINLTADVLQFFFSRCDSKPEVRTDLASGCSF